MGAVAGTRVSIKRLFQSSCAEESHQSRRHGKIKSSMLAAMPSRNLMAKPHAKPSDVTLRLMISTMIHSAN